MSENHLARQLGVSLRRINEIVSGKRIKADTALRLGKFFNMSPQFWLGLQMDYELDVESDRLGERLESEVGRYQKVS
jgi:addiction module HigA family antidote